MSNTMYKINKGRDDTKAQERFFSNMASCACSCRLAAPLWSRCSPWSAERAQVISLLRCGPAVPRGQQSVPRLSRCSAVVPLFPVVSRACPGYLAAPLWSRCSPWPVERAQVISLLRCSPAVSRGQ